MNKKLIFPALLILLMITSCNKGFNTVVGDPNAAVKTLVISASSPLPLKIQGFIVRKAVIPVETLEQYSIPSPYSFTSKKIQSGDAVSVTITNNNNQPFTATLTIDGVDIPATGATLNGSNLYFKYWQFTIQ